MFLPREYVSGGYRYPSPSAMMILGQPRSNSEYIQSSGRVGRGSESAGLVISVLRGTTLEINLIMKCLELSIKNFIDTWI